MRDKVSGARRWVVKIGSALLTADGRGLDQGAMAVWVEQMVALHAAGIELVLVSSGAVAAGMSRLGWQVRPSAIHELQAAAAVGGKGGGRPDMAQGGGTDAAALDGALQLARAFVEQGW